VNTQPDGRGNNRAVAHKYGCYQQRNKCRDQSANARVRGVEARILQGVTASEPSGVNLSGLSKPIVTARTKDAECKARNSSGLPLGRLFCSIVP